MKGDTLRLEVLVPGGRRDRAPCPAGLLRRLAPAGTPHSVGTRRLPGPAARGVDPHRLRERLQGIPADAFVLVGGARWGARRLVPAPVVDGRPVAIAQPGEWGPGSRAPGAPDPDAPWLVTAMAKDAFLEPTEGWAPRLAAGGRKVSDLRADRARRSDLMEALRKGPAVVLYAGHGRSRGWGGYQTVRWHHLEAGVAGTGPSVGVVIAFACDTLARTRNRVPFGSRMVASGIARAYLAPAGSVRTADAEALAQVVVELLAGERPPTLTHLMRAIHHAVSTEADARRAWRRFRLVGDPTVSLASGQATPPPGRARA